MGKARLGRRRGTHNKGYHYRKGRGWYALHHGNRVPLCDERGEHLKQKDSDPRAIEQAYRRWQTAQADKDAQERQPAAQPTQNAQDDDVTVAAVCEAYLAYAQATGSRATYYSRANTLFDFCCGMPARFRPKNGQPPAAEVRPCRCRHPAYGRRSAMKLTALDIDQWLAAHPTWKGGRRMYIQAIKRAMSYGVERKLIPANPLASYKVGKSRGRITCFTDEQEAALLRHARPALRLALRVCIRTGLRYGAEFVPLTARQVVDLGERMEWRVTPKRTKRSEKYRLVRVSDPEIIQIVRQQVQNYPEGPIFRNEGGTPWKSDNLTVAFTRLRRRVERLEKLQFDPDACMNTCRHTYAKRTLQGYWTNKPTTIETLARLMGNTPQVCWDHYVQWCEAYNAALWEAC